jgi:hypothetical protein
MATHNPDSGNNKTRKGPAQQTSFSAISVRRRMDLS